MNNRTILACALIIILCLSGAFLISGSITGFNTFSAANDAISDAEEDIQEMKTANFTTIYVEDTLGLAKEAFTNGNYYAAENYALAISERKDKAYSLRSELSGLLSEIEKKENKYNMSKTREFYSEANSDFISERFEEAELEIANARKEMNRELSSKTTLSRITEANKGFVRKYWWEIIIAISVLVPASWFTYRKIRISQLKSKVEQLKNEKISLEKLIRETQEDRFRDNKISDKVYRVRSNKYLSRAEEIKAELPVLENRLNLLIENKFPRAMKVLKKTESKKGVLEVK